MSGETSVVVVGLGYVGLPLALSLAKNYPVIGFDRDARRITELKQGHDRTGEVDGAALMGSSLRYTSDIADIGETDTYVVAVPTPVDAENRPDLGAVTDAARTVGAVLRPGAIVVFESTVYPGVTEDICGPVLASASGLECGKDFFLGYSPERINPGDPVHTVDRIVKVVAGQTPEVSARLAEMYGSVNGGQIFIAKNIRTAEAAKVIENAQRDINIAFINEITQIFGAMDISVFDVLDAARTKWNFLPFTPGFVGGHCIGVDPYYLAHSATQVGVDPAVVLSGRKINDSMAIYAGDRINTELAAPSHVLVLGLTFKENVPDLRNTKVIDLIRHLEASGHTVSVHDPVADEDEAKKQYDLALLRNVGTDFDCVVLCVSHDDYREMDLGVVLKPGGMIADLKGLWRSRPRPSGMRYWTF